MCLLEHPDLLANSGGTTTNNDDLEVLEDLLLNFSWDDPNITAHQCREMAQRLADSIRVPLPNRSGTAAAGTGTTGKKGTTAKSKNNCPRDDFASYAALVNNSAS